MQTPPSTDTVTPNLALERIVERFDGLVSKAAWGETALFYNPGHILKHGTYFATIKTKDGDNDRASNIDRCDVWRLNFTLPKDVFSERFGAPPARPAKGCAVQGPWDFTALDIILPHPVYGWMSWVAVLSPSPTTFSTCLDLMSISFEKIRQKHARKLAQHRTCPTLSSSFMSP